MNLTVTARIAGGAGLVILLLAMLVFSSLSGVNSINDGLVSVNEQSTPMLVEEGEIVQSLLHAAAEANFYHQTAEISKLSRIEKKYREQIKKNDDALNRLSRLADDFPDISSALNQSKKSIDKYLQIVPKSFEARSNDLNLRNDINSKREAKGL